jgi:hypothetical protein
MSKRKRRAGQSAPRKVKLPFSKERNNSKPDDPKNKVLKVIHIAESERDGWDATLALYEHAKAIGLNVHVFREGVDYPHWTGRGIQVTVSEWPQ